ncbi:MAG TPA: amidohydrolase family protein [Longimicrobiales bacterium]|nr:amidohydrolase family protein [Longimicrobiales bacterium]
MLAPRFLPALALAAGILSQPVDAGAQVRAGGDVVVFEGVNVVPLDHEGVLADQTVVVRDGRIAAVGATGSVEVPAGARRIDGRGRWLMPGLAEMHAHVPPGDATEEGLRDLMFLYVANGITSIRGMLGAPYQLELRERLRAGDILGPTLYVGAPSLNGNSAPTPDSAATLVRAHEAAGYDLLKIHPGLTREAYDAMARTATQLGISWAGHVPEAVGLAHAMAMGQSTVDHLDGMLEASVPAGTLERLRAEGAGYADVIRAADPTRFPTVARAMREHGVWSIPTVLVWANLFTQDRTPEEMAAWPEMRYVSPRQVDGWAEQKRRRVAMDVRNGLTPDVVRHFLELRRGMLRALADAGAPILMGTDSPQLFMVPGFALHRELEIMQDAGLSPYQIYRSGSANVAAYAREDLGLPGDFGTVTVGNRADLVLLEADPLRDVRNLRRRAGVMVRGQWLPAEEIERELDRLAARFTGGE